MIPLKLQLRNFMCYRELETLDFSGIHLACLAGDNGRPSLPRRGKALTLP